MNWFVIYTKRRQEQRALENLLRQGFECYLPMTPIEHLTRGRRESVSEPLFPRYLFIRLDPSGKTGNWSALRSTRGVTRLVSFGTTPATVDDTFIELLRRREGGLRIQPVFEEGEAVRITSGPFSGIEAVFDLPDGDSRALVLIELLSRRTRLSIGLKQLERAT